MSRSIQTMMIRAMMNHDIGSQDRTIYTSGNTSYILRRADDMMNPRVELIQKHEEVCTIIAKSWADGVIATESCGLIIAGTVRNRWEQILDIYYRLDRRCGNVFVYHRTFNEHGYPRASQGVVSFTDSLVTRFTA